MKSGEVGSMAEERVPERRESYVNFSVIDDIQFINFAEDY